MSTGDIETPDKQPSEREKFYDDEIAPRLMEVGKLCQDQGMSIAACVEFETNEVGLTLHVNNDIHACGPQFRLAFYGVRCTGNADSLIGALVKDDARHAGANGTKSFYLHRLRRTEP